MSGLSDNNFFNVLAKPSFGASLSSSGTLLSSSGTSLSSFGVSVSSFGAAHCADCPGQTSGCAESAEDCDVAAVCDCCDAFIYSGDFYYELADGQTFCAECLAYDDAEYIEAEEDGFKCSPPEQGSCCLCGTSLGAERGFYRDIRERSYCGACVVPNTSYCDDRHSWQDEDIDDWRCDQCRGR